MMEDIHGEKETVNGGCYILLMKDRKPICRTQCLDSHCNMPTVWSISSTPKLKKVDIPPGLRCCILCRASENSQQENEWSNFLNFLRKHEKVATGKLDNCEFYILPPGQGSDSSHVKVLYKEEERHHSLQDYLKPDKLVTAAGILRERNSMFENAKPLGVTQVGNQSAKSCKQSTLESSLGDDAVSNSNMIEDGLSHEYKHSNVVGDKAPFMKVKIGSGPKDAMGPNDARARNFVKVDPSYLKTLSQSHSSWIFGAIAELVDNSRDAKATRLEISMGMVHYKPAGRDIPMLSIIDNGHGMTHQEIERMISFGHKQPDADDSDRIGRFGIGFKSGAMRLGKDALVLTQTSKSRSLAFLSQSLNEGKDNLEIPTVSFIRVGQIMELDITVQDEATAKSNLKAIFEFSPFNKYLIGEKLGLFPEKVTGTQVYIWNLDKWGSSYSLRCETEMIGGSSSHQGDIIIHPKRVRSRPGQMSQLVPLDYSLKSYLEIIFFEPRMKIFVQGAPIKTRPLAKSLHQTLVKNGIIMGKPVQLTLGRSQPEWERANCGVFLYWHGRLIEAYKRVGSMIHNGDIGRGIIGVIDLTDLMKDDNDRIWVHNNKQGFQDCEAHAELEKWLGAKTDKYLDKYVNKIQLERAGASLKPDHEWVQCDKCRKWRMLRAGFDCNSLPPEWFCYMEPFNGKCDLPEEKVGDGVVTISAKRSGYNRIEDSENNESSTKKMKSGNEDSSSGENYDTPVSSTRRKGLPRMCKKEPT